MNVNVRIGLAWLTTYNWLSEPLLRENLLEDDVLDDLEDLLDEPGVRGGGEEAVDLPLTVLVHRQEPLLDKGPGKLGPCSIRGEKLCRFKSPCNLHIQLLIYILLDTIQPSLQPYFFIMKLLYGNIRNTCFEKLLNNI